MPELILDLSLKDSEQERNRRIDDWCHQIDLIIVLIKLGVHRVKIKV